MESHEHPQCSWLCFLLQRPHHPRLRRQRLALRAVQGAQERRRAAAATTRRVRVTAAVCAVQGAQERRRAAAASGVRMTTPGWRATSSGLHDSRGVAMACRGCRRRRRQMPAACAYMHDTTRTSAAYMAWRHAPPGERGRAGARGAAKHRTASREVLQSTAPRTPGARSVRVTTETQHLRPCNCSLPANCQAS